MPIDPRDPDESAQIARTAISHVTHITVTVPMRADVVAGLLVSHDELTRLRAELNISTTTDEGKHS